MEVVRSLLQKSRWEMRDTWDEGGGSALHRENNDLEDILEVKSRGLVNGVYLLIIVTP